MISIIKKPIAKIVKGIYRWYLMRVLREEWENPPTWINERSIEFGFALKWLTNCCPRDVLDIGCGTTAWPHIMSNCGYRVTAADKISEYWDDSFINRHYHIINDDITDTKLTGTFDFVTCISVLEHIPDHRTAMRNMFKLLRPGGHMALTIPFNHQSYHENVYKDPDAGYGKGLPFICQIYSPSEINSWLDDSSVKIEEQEFYQVFTGAKWTFGERIYPAKLVSENDNCQLTCILLHKPE